jgi:hypothetical protein
MSDVRRWSGLNAGGAVIGVLEFRIGSEGRRR